jgi:26S proteasome regulatory subunit N10
MRCMNPMCLLTLSCSAEVLATNSKEQGQILKGLHAAEAKIGGSVDISTAISVAALALKHRQNGNARQRIIVFIGSPPAGEGADQAAMIKLAKRLKKNNIAVDIVAFGEAVEEEYASVLRAFVEAVTSQDNS